MAGARGLRAAVRRSRGAAGPLAAGGGGGEGSGRAGPGRDSAPPPACGTTPCTLRRCGRGAAPATGGKRQGSSCLKRKQRAAARFRPGEEKGVNKAWGHPRRGELCHPLFSPESFWGRRWELPLLTLSLR